MPDHSYRGVYDEDHDLFQGAVQSRIGATPEQEEQAETSNIKRVGVIGAGLMGSGIAEVCARAGLDVVVREIDDDAAAAGRARITASFDRGVKAEKLTQQDHEAALGRLTITTDLGDLGDRDLVIEAATRNPAVKAALFADLDAAVKRRDAILATSTSSIPIIEVARATSRPPKSSACTSSTLRRYRSWWR
jgi:3-hydroxybutyryl-CoA dehydrogenase